MGNGPVCSKDSLRDRYLHGLFLIPGFTTTPFPGIILGTHPPGAGARGFHYVHASDWVVL